MFGVCILFVFLVGSSTAVCPNGWHEFQNSCFHLHNNLMNWNDAQASCQAEKARLAQVETKGKNEFLRNLLASTNTQWWLGAKDDVTEGQWRWASGELLDYTDWAPNEPNDNGDQDCLQMYELYQYHWDDEFCSREKHFICERMTDESIVGR